MAKRKSTRTSVLDWWQAVLDETKDFVDDSIGRLRDEDDVSADIQELKRAVSDLNAKLDRIASGK